MSNVLAMEVLAEGNTFRLVEDSELENILQFLEKYLPESIKVRNIRNVINKQKMQADY